jgi:hypothetical protein
MRAALTAAVFFTVLGIAIAATADPTTYYVATRGNDAWSGTLAEPNSMGTDGPFATLERARDALRARTAAEKATAEGGMIVLQGGTYILSRPFELSAMDSGTEQAPIVYTAAHGARVRLVGGKLISNWRPVTDEGVLAQVDPMARTHLMQANLKGEGIHDFGSPGGGGIELFFNGKPMMLSRWPNQGFVPIVSVLGETECDVRGTKGCVEGIFEYSGDRPARWLAEPEPWVHGYWFWDWSEQRHPVKSIDTSRRSIEVAPPYHNYGYRKGQWYYAFNLLSEIDEPGEWYLNRTTGILYFWPPSPVDQGETIVSTLPSMAKLNNVSHVTLRSISLEAARGTAVTISGGESNQLLGCTICNVSEWGVTVAGGRKHRVSRCNIYQVGAGGVLLDGGDRTTLVAAEHIAEDNHIHDFARVKRVYQPGINLRGVGNQAVGNLIHDAPHMAIGFGGNDHLIALNEIHDVCTESNDAGAIYAGRDWTMRGTVIRNNYLHHINGFEGRGCVGVYLDDMYCGTEITGNLFYRVTRAAFIGGGRDCVVSNNLFVDCQPALHIDGRALGWAHDHSDQWIEEGRRFGTLSGIRYREPPYRDRYPQLVTILEEEPAAPKGNRVFCNVSFGGRWDGVQQDARVYQTIENNLIDTDPRFVTPERIGDGKRPRAEDFELRPDSPAWPIGFEPLPLQQIAPSPGGPLGGV